MCQYLKILTLLIVFSGFATTAQAGTQKQSNVYTPKASSSLQTVSTKRIVRKVKRLPATHKAATHSTRSVLFYKHEPVRSKVLSVRTSKTRTPNAFK